MKTYDIIEHTADVGIRAYGKNFSECFANAAQGMFSLITDDSQVTAVGQYEINLKSPDLEQLLVDWLAELLFIHSAKNIVFGKFHVTVNEKNNSLHAKIFGEPYTLKKHKYGIEIKAVTYHMLKVEKQQNKCIAQAIFDI